MYKFEQEIRRADADLARLYRSRRRGGMTLTVLFAVLLAVALVAMCQVIGANRAEAQEWHSTNQATVAWDAVTQTVDGLPISPEDVSYDIFLANAVTDPGKTNPSMIQADVVETQYTITLNVEGQFFVGIRAVRMVALGRIESTICWSDDGGCSPVPFGLRRFSPPAGVQGLRIASE